MIKFIKSLLICLCILGLAAGPAATRNVQSGIPVYTSRADGSTAQDGDIISWSAANGMWYATAGGGGAPTTAKYWTSEASGDLSAEVNLGALTTGLLKHTVAAGVSTPATATAADLPSGIDATKIADGSVTDTEFQYINTLASNAQTQINNAVTAISSATTINPGHHHIVSAIATGTADAMVGTFTPAVAALTDGMRVDVYAVGANTVVDPTFQYNALVAKTIVKGAATALAVGDIPEANYKCELSYRAATDKWVLINPAITTLSVGTGAGNVAAGNAVSLAVATPATTAAQNVGTGASPTFVNVNCSAVNPSASNAYRSGGSTTYYLYEYKGYTVTYASGFTGATKVVSGAIPAKAIVTGVVVKVTTLITSDNGGTTFSVGDGVTANKWGSGIPFAVNTFSNSSYYPAGDYTLKCYPTAGDVTITCDDTKTFSAGAAQVVVFWTKLTE